MMRGRYSMDRVMDTEFRGDHSGSVSIDFMFLPEKSSPYHSFTKSIDTDPE